MDKIRVHDKNFKLFISNKEIENRIKTLANNISKDLKDKNPLFV